MLKRGFKILVTMLLISMVFATHAYATDSVHAVAAGGQYFIELKEDGGLWEWGNVWVWDAQEYTHVEVNPVPQLKLSNVKAMAAGASHRLAIKYDGTLWAWGSNTQGQLGNGKQDFEFSSVQPIKIMSKVSMCFANGDASMVLKMDGTLWAWGELFNRRSDYALSNYPKPRRVMSKAVHVAVGYFHYLAVRTDGTVWAWGSNYFGQLGSGNTKYYSYPRKVEGLADVTMAAAGAYHSLALKTDGTLWAWGNNEDWQLGIETKENPIVRPIKIMENVKYIAANDCHSMAIKADGTLWAWGNNEYNQLGVGKVDYPIPEDWVEDDWPRVFRHYMRNLPTQIMKDVKQVSVTVNNAIALKEDGSVWAWGNGSVPGEENKSIDKSIPRLLHK